MLEVNEAQEARSKNTIVPEGGEHEPLQIFGKRYPTYLITNYFVQYPTIFCAAFSFIPLLFTILAIGSDPSIDRSATSFSVSRHPVSEAIATMNQAQETWRNIFDQKFIVSSSGKSRPIGRSVQSERLFIGYRVDSVKFRNYFSIQSPQDEVPLLGARNLFNMSIGLPFIANVEAAITNLPLYKTLCWSSRFRGGSDGTDFDVFPLCTPMSSIMTYFRAGSMYNVSGVIFWELDGVTGSLQFPLESVLDRFFVNPHYRWFVDQSCSPTNRVTSLLRTQISLGTPVIDPDTFAFMAPNKVNDLVDELVLSLLDLRNSDELQHPFIDVLIGGDRIQSALILRAVAQDALWIGLSIVVVFFLFWYHFHSVVLALLSVTLIALTYPSSFYIYVASTGVKEVSVLISLSFYITLILTVDSMMIIFDTFNHSGFMTTNGRVNNLTLGQRVAYTYRKAGVGVGMSALISLVCFAINTASPIPAIRSFATLMVIMICLDAFTLLLIFPNAVLFHHFHVSRRRRNLQRQREILLERQKRRRYPPQVSLMQEMEKLRTRAGEPTLKGVEAYMDAELEHEQQDRDRRGGVLAVLGVRAPIRLPNPFPNRQETYEQYSFQPETFPNAIPDGKGGVCLQSDTYSSAHLLPPAEVLQIRNINCDEALGFDDSQLRQMLLLSGHSAATEFSGNELISLAPSFGIVPCGSESRYRIINVTRMAIYLLFGVARTLNIFAVENVQNKKQRRAKKRDVQQEQPAPGKKAKKMTTRIADWWADRQEHPRKWCGIFGERVGETQAEKERRILSKKVKHQGFTRVERFFFNQWAPMIHFLRYGICVFAVMLLIATSVLTAFLQPSSTAPTVLGENPSEQFDRLSTQFAESGTCDYCSAYFRPVTDFPVPTLPAIQACVARYGMQLIHASVDSCKTCLGNDECVDCAGVPFGKARFDSCNQCLLPTDVRWNQCIRCSYNSKEMRCSPCVTELNASVGYSGANCASYCDSNICPPSRGVCNMITGECDCYQDFVKGFWMSDPLLQGNSDPRARQKCSICLTGFSGANCTVECNNSGPPCFCDRGRCTGCVPGFLGEKCGVLWTTICVNGYFDIFTRYAEPVCVCKTNWSGSDCSVSSLCSNRGAPSNVSRSPPGFRQCVCRGQWGGLQCDVCRCFNGGQCAVNGTCLCSGAWTGSDCSACEGGCRAHGVCPTPWPPLAYTLDQCRGLFCTDTELIQFNATSAACIACNRPSGSICETLSASECLTLPTCGIDNFTKSCTLVAAVETGGNSSCTCLGAWKGENCSVCTTPHPDVTCDAKGILRGCDELPGVGGVYKVRDVCGNCGGSSQCIGCDGVPGSTKVIDRCGVCGGFNECAVAGGENIVSATAVVNIIWGLDLEGHPLEAFDMKDAKLQQHLLYICTVFLSRPDIIKAEQSRCVWLDFVFWMQRPENTAKIGYSMTFPFDNYLVHAAFFAFIKETGRVAEAGFSSANPSDPDFRTTWMVFPFRTASVPQFASSSVLRDHYDTWATFIRRIAPPKSTLGPPLMACDSWVVLITQEASRKGTIFSLSFGIIAFMALILPFSCSITISLIGTFILAGCATSVMALVYLVGWTLGPIEQVALSLLVGTCSGQVVQMIEGYLEYLHSAQSHFFARDATKLQALKGMFQRTGSSIVLSKIALIICSLLLFGAELYAFRRIGALMLMILLTSLVFCSVIFGGVLATVGPVESFRGVRVSVVFAIVGTAAAVALMLTLWLTGAISL